MFKSDRIFSQSAIALFDFVVGINPLLSLRAIKFNQKNTLEAKACDRIAPAFGRPRSASFVDRVAPRLARPCSASFADCVAPAFS